MLPTAGPSTGQTCGLVLISAVLLQSICVAVTFLYFTNELKQVSSSHISAGLAALRRAAPCTPGGAGAGAGSRPAGGCKGLLLCSQPCRARGRGLLLSRG